MKKLYLPCSIVFCLFLLLGCSSNRSVTGVTDVESGISAQVLSPETKTALPNSEVLLKKSSALPWSQSDSTYRDTSNSEGLVHFSVEEDVPYTLYCTVSTGCALLEQVLPQSDTLPLEMTTPTTLTLSFATTDKGYCYIPGTPLLYAIDPKTKLVTFPLLPRDKISVIAYIEDTTDLYSPDTLLTNVDLTSDTSDNYILIDSLWEQPFLKSNIRGVAAFCNSDNQLIVGTKEQGIWYSSDQKNWSNSKAESMSNVITIEELKTQIVVVTPHAIYFTSKAKSMVLIENTPSALTPFQNSWIHADTLYVITEKTLWKFSDGSWHAPISGGQGLTDGICEPDGTVHITSNSGTWEVKDGALSEVTIPSEQFNNDSLYNPIFLHNGSLLVSSHEGGFWHYNSGLWYFYNSTTHEGKTSILMYNDTLGLKVSSDYTITTFTVKESLHSSAEIKTIIPYQRGITTALFKSSDNVLYLVNSEIGVMSLTDCSILE